MFVPSADKLAEIRTKFHIIQAKLIISLLPMVLHCALFLSPKSYNVSRFLHIIGTCPGDEIHSIKF